MPMTVRTTVALAALLFGSVALAQAVFRTVDADGNVTYTDRPPAADATTEVLSLSTLRPATSASIATDDAGAEDVTDPAPSGVAEAQARAELQAEQAAIDAARQASLQAQRQSNCNTAQERLSRYSTARRIYRESDGGEREYLSDTEMDAEREHAARAVSEWCDSSG